MKRAIVLAVLLIVLAVLMKGPSPHPTPNPPGAFSFATMGDAPYYWWEELRYRLLRRELDAYDLRFTIHVGDIWWHPCSDAMYRKTKQQFDALRAPVFYTPGDNEWTDCWERGSGSHAPLERLTRLRQIFYGSENEFAENRRWRHEHIVFATVNMPGSFNAMDPFPNRTAADDEAAKRRTNAAAAWTRATFEDAKRTNARAVVIAFHGTPPFEKIDPKYHQAWEPFIGTLEDEARQFRKPVLVIHGDDHEYTVDHPQRDAPNLTRLEVPGSPDVGWVRVIVNNDSTFAFEKHVIGTWKWW
ncbi:MAG TPA: hypothetical protein VKB93_09815 [Thermoanaerobaculia bacterium]|nr:hypothetical protein [Thermoanaerobaculia bacterium]